MEGTYPVGTPQKDLWLMVQSLLEDRFKRILRPISQETQVHALVIAEDNGRLVRTDRNGISGRLEFWLVRFVAQGMKARLDHNRHVIGG